jgi:hypothetical protein
MALRIGIGTNLRIQGGFLWTPEFPLGGETPNFWVKSGNRNGLNLPDTVNPGAGDANILLPYLYKPTGNEYAQAANPLLSDTTFTVCAWIKAEYTDKASAYHLLGKYLGGQVGDFFINAVVTTGYISLYVITNTPFTGYNIVSTVDFTTAGWVFVRADHNSATNTFRLFINEIQVGTYYVYAGVFGSNSANFTVGGSRSASLGKSSYSDTYIYPFILSPTEAATLMARGHIAGATAHWTFNEEIENSNKYYDVTGNGNHLTPYNITSAKRKYFANGSRWSLDHGHTLYNHATQGNLYVGNSDAGTQLLGDSLVLDYTYTKVRTHAGNATNHNFADSLIRFPLGSKWDRSNVTIWSALARAGYYDISNPTDWHPSELNQMNIDSWLNTAYCDIVFVKASTDSISTRNYVQEIFSYSSVKSEDNMKIIFQYTGDYNYFFTELNLISTQSAILNQVTIGLILGVNQKVKIDWGNGTIDTFVGIAATQVNKTSNYAGAGTYNIKIYWYLRNVSNFVLSNITVSGNLSEFNKLTILSYLSLAYANIIGNINVITCTLTTFSNVYNTGIFGDLKDLPATLTGLSFYGIDINHLANLYGDVADFPVGLIELNLDFIIAENITGDCDDLPVTLNKLNLGGPYYAVIGNLNNLSRLHQFCIDGTYGTWTGSINSLNDAGMVYLSFENMPNLTGTVESCVSTLQVMLFIGANNVVYGGGATPAWILSGSGMRIKAGWSSVSVDNFLIALAASLPHNTNNPAIKFDYPGMGARTSASDAAVATLTTNHYVVTTN